jgi:CHAT domain-containing protein
MTDIPRPLPRLLVGSIILFLCHTSSAHLSSSAPPGAAAHAAAIAKVSASAAPSNQQGGGAGAELESGRALLRRGRAGEALVHLENSLRMFRQGGDKSGEIAARDLLGELYEQQGRYDVALEHYQQAFKLLTGEDEKGSDKKSGAYNANLLLARIGQMHYRQGNLTEAAGTFNRMKVKKPDTGKLGKAKRSGGLLGGLAIGLGSDDSSVSVSAPAFGAALSAKQQFDFYRQTIIYASYEIGLGRIAYDESELARARKHFENALSATRGDLPFIGDLGQARRYRTAARTSLGDVAFRQGRFAEALKFYREAARGAQKDRRLDLMWPAQRGTARSLWAQGQQERDAKKAAALRESSLAAYRDALKSIETIRQGSLRADEARTTFLATTKDVFDEASSAFAEMALTFGANATGALEGRALEYAGEALRIVEQGRARSLLDLLGETGANITEGVPARLQLRKQENLRQQNETAALLTGLSLSAEAPAQSVEKLEKELDRLQAEYDSLENEIRAASPRYAALTAPQPLTLDEIQQQVLDDQTALLEYSLGEEASYLWAVVREGAALYKLPAREILNRQAVDMRARMIPRSLLRPLTEAEVSEPKRDAVASNPLSSQDASSFVAASNALYESALSPAASFFKGRRLLVVPDGALSYIPFEALITATGGADYASLPYLTLEHEIIYAPSASVVLALRQQAAGGVRPTARSMLLIADPVFEASDPRALQAGGAARREMSALRGLTLTSAIGDVIDKRPTVGIPDGGFKLSRLAETRAEAQQIAQYARAAGLSADTWLDLEASEANTNTRDLRAYRVLHIATHGLLNTERPQFTGIVLTLVGNSDSDDGFLRTDEIFNLKLGSPLVMLSACETGLGKEKRGEGVIGLTRAFMYAGAPTVGVSLWSVADRSTADLMTDFYRRLLGKDGATHVAAMRAARREMITGKKYSAPFFWAPFIFVGDWRAQVDGAGQVR